MNMSTKERFRKIEKNIEALQEERENESFCQAVFDVTLGVAIGLAILMAIMHIN